MFEPLSAPNLPTTPIGINMDGGPRGCGCCCVTKQAANRLVVDMFSVGPGLRSAVHAHLSPILHVSHNMATLRAFWSRFSNSGLAAYLLHQCAYLSRYTRGLVIFTMDLFLANITKPRR